MEKRFNIFFFLILTLPLLAAGASVSKAQAGVVGTELWCVAKNNAEDAALQTALSWACGPGAADCSPIQQGGPCYDASDIVVTASYAFNDYYLKHGLSTDSCSFDNTAALTSLNPSQSQKLFILDLIFVKPVSFFFFPLTLLIMNLFVEIELGFLWI